MTGIILTRIDGDGKGGAALSMKSVANCPIKFLGVGEKIDDFEIFHPERTASDGKNLHTGIVDINSEYESLIIAGQRVKGSTKQQNLEDKNSTIGVEFPNWSEGKNFTYENPNLLVENIDSDVDNELNKDGFTTDSKEDASDELVEESEDVIFVKAIKALTENVKSFFSSLFGFRTEITPKD